MRLDKYYEFVQADFEAISSFHMKDELNQKIWENGDLDDEVRRNLLMIGQDFYAESDLKADVVDVVLCGSLCNYNWSERYSDYDLHVIIHYKDIDDDLELAEKVCDLSKKIWNLKHDIKIAGYEVEVMIQDEDDMNDAIKGGRMGGVYSLMKDKWIRKPERKDFVPDEKLIRSKAETVMSQIDELEEEINEDKYEEFVKKLDGVWKRIKDFRKSGLESESGEFSIGNLVFKLLRRNGYTDKVMKMKRVAYDRQFEKKQNEL
jgi:hypothetical protein